MSEQRPPQRASHIFDTLRDAGLLARRIFRHETMRVPMTSTEPEGVIQLSLMALEEQDLPTSISRIPDASASTVSDAEDDPPTAISSVPEPAEKLSERTLDQQELLALIAEREGALDEGPTALSPHALGAGARAPDKGQESALSMFQPMPASAGVVPAALRSPHDTAGTEPAAHLSTGSISLQTLPTIPLLTPEHVMEHASTADLILRHPIGEGGTGKVYLAVQRSLGRHVAVKYARVGTSKPNAVSMLLHEGALMGHLEHPNIIPVHVLGCDAEQQPVLVMKYIEGVSWAALLKDDAHPFWEKLRFWSHAPLMRHLEILLEICKAIEYAHSRGIIHLDIKPDNVMLGDFGEVYLMDWGIARHSPRAQRADLGQTLPPIVPDVEGVCGTPMYMAPEMFSDAQHLDERTDVYLLGATLYELLTGHPPHDGQTLLEAFVSAFQPIELAAAPGLPEKLVSLCRRAMHLDPRERFPDVQSFRTELIDYLRHRASYKCSETASGRLDDLRQYWRIEPEAGAVSTHRQQLLQLFAECRFGFRQALQIWDGNEAAREGLEEAVRLMFEVEYARRDVEAAAVLLEELSSPPQAMVEQLRGLRLLLAEEQKEQERLRQLQRELDASIAQRQRVRLLLMMGVVASFFALIRFVWGPTQSYQRAIALSVLTTLIVSGFLYRGRKDFLQNELNRRFASLILFCCFSVLVHRSTRAWLQHPLPLTYASDLLMLAWIFLTAALTWRWWLLSLAVVYLLGAVLAFWQPTAAIYIMAVCLISGWLLCAYFWVWEQKRQLYST